MQKNYIKNLIRITVLVNFQAILLIFSGETSSNRDITELTQPRRRLQQGRHKFAYLIVKNNTFARFARAVFIFDISQTFSFFLRREMTCFAVVWTT